MAEKPGINEIMEHIIEKTGIAPFNVNNKALDFNIDDVVKCSYLTGLFKVIDLCPSRNLVTIYPVDLLGEFEDVHAPFLEKISADEKTMKVLFDE